MAKLIHTMIRVIDIDQSMAFYADLLGLQESHRLDFPDFALVYLLCPESGAEIELTLNKGRTEPYTHGDGYGHLAVSVDDVDGAHASAKAAGLNPGDVKEFHRDGSLMAKFFFLQDPDGYKIEVLKRHGRYT